MNEFTMALPGSMTLADVTEAMAAVRDLGNTVSDPDSWETPEQSADGNWHISVW